MKLVSLPKVIGASVLGLSLAVMPAYFPVSAQTTTGGTGTGTGTTGTGTTTVPADNGTGTGAGTGAATTNNGGGGGGYWGLFGLVGLLGLAGLNRGRGTPATYRDTDEVAGRTGTTRY